MNLNQKTLPDFKSDLATPSYDRKRLRSGIVHIGVGAFHRSHQGAVINSLLKIGGNIEWGVCGIGLREEDRKLAKILESQDNLYTLIVRHPNGYIESEIMGQMTGFLLAHDNKVAVIEKIASQETKIVSLTITEGGYKVKTDGEFDCEHPEIQHDLHNPEDPITIYGYLFSALKKRHENGDEPFTVMSCDNIQHNGDVLKKMLISFVSHQDTKFAAWILENVSFPNSMVDRITPATSPDDERYLAQNYNLHDKWPVSCEPFLQWVIEDKFSMGRPNFDQIDGVQFVDDVAPYEKMKIRLLNAGHSILGIIGALQGAETINACMENKSLVKFLIKFWDQEASPILDKVEGINLGLYKSSLIERFSNKNILDNVSRICSESSAKIPKFLLPTIVENLKQGGSIHVATTVIAAWCYYSDKHVDVNGQGLKIVDDLQEMLHCAAKNTKNDKLSFLRLDEVFGELIENSEFTSLYVQAIEKIYEEPTILNE